MKFSTFAASYGDIDTTRPTISMRDLYTLWDALSNVATDEGGNIEAPFLHFACGTFRETIWRWFERKNTDFVVGDVCQGIRRAEFA